ncbi:MAG: GNAT family N-acetyltransferase [Actinomycetota bacterium]|nr:GNAT family N-acetyltransferase [Actinomycetota bacterium]
MNLAVHRSWSADLDNATLYALLALRVEIFVVEQNCPYPELDGLDLLPDTRHLWLAGDGEVVCTLRLMQLDRERPDFRIGRLCTAKAARGQGLARRLMHTALAEVGAAPSRVHAQSHLAGFYGDLGFAQDGEEFTEDGIAHVPMLRAGR